MEITAFQKYVRDLKEVLPVELSGLKSWLFVQKNKKSPCYFSKDADGAVRIKYRDWASTKNLLTLDHIIKLSAHLPPLYFSQVDAVGMVFRDDLPYVGIDLDNCILGENDNSVISSAAMEVISELTSNGANQVYCELSRSGKGVHLVAKYSPSILNAPTLKAKNIEVYSRGRYFIFTGHKEEFSRLTSYFIEPSNTIHDITKELKHILNDNSGEDVHSSLKNLPLSLLHSVPEGSRHALLLAKGGKYVAADATLSSVDDVVLYLEAVARKFDNYAEFIDEGGSRRKELLEVAKYLFTNRLDKAHTITSAKRAELTAELETTVESSLLQELKQYKLKLTESMYTSAPGIVGAIVKDMLRTAIYPCAPAAFASAVSLVATLQGVHRKTEFNSYPSLYFLVLAPTGSGKEHPQKYSTKVIQELRLTEHTTSDMRSHIGLIKELERGNGKVLIHYDEFHKMLAAIQRETSDNGAAHYLSELKAVIAKLFSKAGGSYTLSGTAKERKTLINGILINLVGYSVPEEYVNLISYSSVADGLYQRIIVIKTEERAERKRRRSRRTADGSMQLVSDKIISELKEVAKESYKSIRLQDELDAIERDIEAYKQLPSIEPQDDSYLKQAITKKAEISKQLEFIQSSEVKAIVVTYTDTALDKLEQFSDEMDDLYLKIRTDESMKGLEGAVTRAAELVERLSLVLSGYSPVIDCEIIDYSIDFIRTHTLSNLYDLVTKKEEQDITLHLYRIISRKYLRDGVPIRKRTVLQNSTLRKLCREHGYTPNQVYNELLKSNMITEEERRNSKAIYVTPTSAID